VVEGAASARSKQLAEEVALPTGGALEFEFTPLPHNENFELDLHRPFIDEIKLVGEAGETLERASEVMDVWFDSGAMPWAQDRENLLYPADYICEAIDQTRGWFYTLLAIATLLEAGAPYKNAISLGHLLDSRGKKMSKSVGNVVDPWLMMEKYGADVLRFWFYSVSQPGESKNFDEQTVLEVSRKVFNPLLNVLSFYQLYAGQGAVASQPSGRHALDRWLLARLAQTTSVVTSNLESYQITEAARALRDLVGDLSQWYLRRSRERIKAGGSAGEAALATLGFALAEIAKLLAPFAPFTAERLWQALGRGQEAESVHLAEWPRAEKFDEEDLILMSRAREVVTLALEARQAAGFKVRQPLASLKIKTSLPAELAAIVAEEVNVKEVVEDTALEQAVSLDTTLTPELVVAGELREILRELQERRKQAGLAPGAPAKLTLGANLPGREFWTEQAAAILPAVAVTAVKWEAEPPAAEAWHLGHKLFKFNLEAA
jgi:isoleucyl-tRNA synthetase